MRAYVDQVPPSAGMDMPIFGGEYASLAPQVTIANAVARRYKKSVSSALEY